MCSATNRCDIATEGTVIEEIADGGCKSFASALTASTNSYLLQYSSMKKQEEILRCGSRQCVLEPHLAEKGFAMRCTFKSFGWYCKNAISGKIVSPEDSVQGERKEGRYQRNIERHVV